MSDQEPVKKQNKTCLQADIAERVFRTASNYGVEVTSDFKEYKLELSNTYDCIRQAQHEMFSGGKLEFPEVGQIYRAYLNIRKTLGGRAPSSDGEEFIQWLCMLAGQQDPFIEFLRQLTVSPAGDFRVITRVAVQLPEKPDAVEEGRAATVEASLLALREHVDRRKGFPDWEAIYLEILKTGKFSRGEMLKGRIDPYLKMLFLSQKTRDKNFRAQITRINDSLKRHIYAPLLSGLKTRKMIHILSCRDIRESSEEKYGTFPDIMYFNNQDRLLERFKALGKILISAPAQKYLNSKDITSFKELSDADDSYMKKIAGLANFHLGDVRQGKDYPYLIVESLVEVARLGEWIEAYAREKREHDEANKLNEIFEELKTRGNLIEGVQKGKTAYSQNHMEAMLSGRAPRIITYMDPLSREKAKEPGFSPANADKILLLARDQDCTANAINTALQEFRENRDELLFILEEMLEIEKRSAEQLHVFIPDDSLKALRAALQGAYMNYVPWYSRILAWLTRKKLSPEMMAEAKKNRAGMGVTERAAGKSKSEKLAEKDARDKVREKAREAELGDGPVRVEANPADDEPIKGAIVKKKKKLDPRTLSYKRIKKFLNVKSQNGDFPAHQDLVNNHDLGDSMSVNGVLGAVEKGDPEYDGILKIPLKAGGDAVYVTQEFVDELGPDIQKKCYAELEQFKKKISRGGEPDASQLQQLKRREEVYNALIYRVVS